MSLRGDICPNNERGDGRCGGHLDGRGQARWGGGGARGVEDGRGEMRGMGEGRGRGRSEG